MKKICVMNQKGGSGKSTTVLLIAEALKTSGNILLVDCDPQGGISSLLGVKGRGLFDLLTEGEAEPIGARGVDVIPADHRLDKIAYTLGPYELNAVNYIYDYVIFDTPPTVQGITRAAALVSDLIIIPADIAKTTMGPTLYTLDELRKLKKTGHVLLIGKEPKPEARGYMAELYREFFQAVKGHYAGTLPKSASAQKAAAGLQKIPAAMAELLRGII